MSVGVTQPLDLIRLSLDEIVFVKCRNDRQLQGRLIAFDQHLNMVLSNAKETYIKKETDPETEETISNKIVREFEMIYLRGDTVTLISPMVKT